MKSIMLFFGLVASVTSTSRHQEIAKYVNSLGTTWVATETPSITNVTNRLGAFLPDHPDYYELPAKTYEGSGLRGVPIPESFDVREQWPNCANVTSRIYDQSNCGSCWAHSSTNSFNDRYCIATNDNTKVFSVSDLLSCCSGFSCGFSKACSGGQPSSALKWITTTGVVEGKENGDTSTCKPYPFPSCAHHVTSKDLPSCDTLPDYTADKCSSTCEYGETTYSKDKFFGTKAYSLKSVEDIQRDMVQFGSVSMSFTVYEDFETYSSGVYQHTGKGKQLGGHAIRCYGYGVENNVPYWLCANSWNTEWGNKGTFKILRGSNECGIESGVSAIQV